MPLYVPEGTRPSPQTILAAWGAAMIASFTRQAFSVDYAMESCPRLRYTREQWRDAEPHVRRDEERAADRDARAARHRLRDQQRKEHAR